MSFVEKKIMDFELVFIWSVLDNMNQD